MLLYCVVGVSIVNVKHLQLKDLDVYVYAAIHSY